jgi:translation initiation factor 1A
VLVGLRDYQDDKADIILKYSPDEARNLIKYGEIPDTTTINENTGEEGAGEDDEVVFDFNDIEEI